MTTKNRKKICKTCNEVFFEKPRDSNNQWENRNYCSMKCNNSSPDRITNIFDRLERYQIKQNGCWKWSGAKDNHGYGILSSRIGNSYAPEKAHRVSYEKHYGIKLGKLFVCHKCDNPECTNPEHLFLGTQKDNMQDMANKGRINLVILKNLRREKALTESQVKEIEKMQFRGKNGRGVGVTVKEIAEKYNVCANVIRKVKYGRY